MVEKTGHKKVMQSMRMEWINEGKPRSSVHEGSLFDEPALHARDGEREKTASRVAPIFEKTMTERPKTPVAAADANMDDLYDATPRPARRKSAEVDSQDSLFGGGASLFGPAKTVDDGPPDDELDALLAEEEMLQAGTRPPPTTSKVGLAKTIDDELPEDELDALLAEEQVLQGGAAKALQTVSKAPDKFDDDMEAMAEMDDLWDM
jgi:replication fork protection complex subunit Csm3/Swi3